MRFTLSLAFLITGATLSACTEVDETDAQEADTSAEIQIKPHVAWQLDAGTNEGGNAIVTVTHTKPDGSIGVDGTCQNASCPFAFIDGTVVHVSVSPQADTINCEIFHHWTGACTGQGRTSCTFTIHSNLVTEAIYVPMLGCSGG